MLDDINASFSSCTIVFNHNSCGDRVCDSME
jgi:hypothetical protein